MHRFFGHKHIFHSFHNDVFVKVNFSIYAAVLLVWLNRWINECLRNQRQPAKPHTISNVDWIPWYDTTSRQYSTQSNWIEIVNYVYFEMRQRRFLLGRFSLSWSDSFTSSFGQISILCGYWLVAATFLISGHSFIVSFKLRLELERSMETGNTKIYSRDKINISFIINYKFTWHGV